MYTCERCGTRFGRVTASESCPRCLAREGVRVALASQPVANEAAGPTRPRSGSLEGAVRERLASMAPERRRSAGPGSLPDAA